MNEVLVQTLHVIQTDTSHVTCSVQLFGSVLVAYKTLISIDSIIVVIISIMYNIFLYFLMCYILNSKRNAYFEYCVFLYKMDFENNQMIRKVPMMRGTRV